MSKFAPVCPIRILKAFQRDRKLGDYHLLLAHDIVASELNRKLYSDVFVKSNMARDAIILDNSIIELGSAVNLDVIVEAAFTVKADVVVLPDVLLDGPGTTDSILRAIDPWFKALNVVKGPLYDKVGFMAVPQGRTLQEFLACAVSLAHDPRITWWGVPRNLVGTEVGTRHQAAHLLHAINPRRKIHLLGFSDNLVDDILCARLPFVSGIDSAVPIRAATEGKIMSPILQIGPRGDWWDVADYHPQMNVNLDITRQLMRGFGA